MVDGLRGDAAGGQDGEAFAREFGGVEREERVCGLHGAQAMVQGEEAGEVVEVGDEGSPYWSY
ncbi:MAG: hypothetical protein AOY29_03595 [Alcanivorax borkumensis]|nr:MAG: hypothetical protein AOY29_03595 [Alcanivorax borkumensis]